MRRRLPALLLALAASLAPAAPAAAVPAASVNVIACAFGGGATVPAGAPITVRFSWSSDNLGRARTLLSAASVVVSIDGAPVVDATSDLSAPEWSTTAQSWVSTWTYPTGQTLAASQSMTVTVDLVLSHPITLQKLDSKGVDRVGPGSVFGGPISCLIGAA
jgi:hypothetical protein